MEVSGGTVHGELRASGSSQVTMSDGLVESEVEAYGDSEVTMSGGSANKINLYESSNVTVSGGSVDWGFYAYGNSNMLISGGSISSPGQPSLNDNSQLTISGGEVEVSHVRDNSQLTLTDGTLSGYLELWDNGQVTISGGTASRSFAISGILAFDGEYFEINGTQVDYGEYTYSDYPEEGEITGILASGDILDSDFDFDAFNHNADDGTLVLIPEPGTFVMLLLGGLVLIGRRRRV